MSDLISRSALLERIAKLATQSKLCLCGAGVVVDGVRLCTLIDSAPAVDAVEVVRCAECVYWQDNNGGYPHEDCRWGKGETPDADDFCSYGERKGDDG